MRTFHNTTYGEHDMTDDVPAGWYPDPHLPSQRRFWNGSAWTEHVDAQTAPPPPSASMPTAPLHTMPLPIAAWAPPPPAAREWWKKPWVVATGGFVAFVVLVAAVADNGDEPTPVAADGRPTITVTAQPTQDSTADTPEVPAPVEASPAPTSAATAPAPDEPKAVEGGPDGSWVMPDESGKDLQAAQDHIQGITDNPFFFTDSADATEADRFQILDVDWTVCSQKPSAGSSFDENTSIMFYVVKDWEDCP
jgi:hypothetical protein